MFSLYLECKQEEKDLLIAELWEQGSSGITESDAPGNRCGLRAFFEDVADRSALLEQLAGYGAEWRAEEPRDWVEMARSKLQPQTVGSRFFLVPQWRSDPTPPGRLRIEVNPGLAFGTGAHETTQLCLEALERELKPGMQVLDVGAGSGILSEAATLLGAGVVIACDADPAAVEVARRNQVVAFVGSAPAVKSENVDLILANISPEAITALAPELVRCLRPDGAAILSGFEVQETESVRTALESSGARVKESQWKGNWSALIVTRKPGPPARW